MFVKLTKDFGCNNKGEIIEVDQTRAEHIIKHDGGHIVDGMMRRTEYLGEFPPLTPKSDKP